jgi:hypothetical protein
MKFMPSVIRYEAIAINNPIRNKTDNIGFLLIITNTPNNIDNNDITVKKL